MEIIEKKWGQEVVICNNEAYAAKILVINNGAMCSVHRHPKKDETFYVLRGEVNLEVAGEIRLLIGPDADAVRIPPGTWHRFEGVTFAEMLEVSTPHSDEDVERLTESMGADERRRKEGE